MPDKNRKLIDEFKALGAPAAAPRPRATKVSQFENDYRNSLAREQAEREQAVKSGLTSWATDIPGTVADLAVDLPYYLGQRVMGRRGDAIRPLGYGERVRAELATALGLQNPPSDEVGMRPMPAHEEVTDAISLLNPLAWTVAGDPVGIARAGTKAVKSVGKAVGKEAGRRIDDAMMTGEGMLGSALAPARPNFIFIGPSAKTWDKSAAFKASQMERAGKSPEEIWAATKTFKGADGNWRQEVSDQSARFQTEADMKAKAAGMKEQELANKALIAESKLHPDLFPKQLTAAQKDLRAQTKALRDERTALHGPETGSAWRGNFAKYALDHPELYEAYPELADMIIKQGGKGMGGAHATLWQSAPAKAGDPLSSHVSMDIYESGLKNNPRSSALHEMQHAIQGVEGWSPGGSPMMAFKDPRSFDILNSLRQTALTPMSFEDYAQRFAHVSDLNKGYEQYKSSIPGLVQKMDRELQTMAAQEYYRRLTGEAEARATQARRDMGATERAQTMPGESFDVPLSDQIVKPADYAHGGTISRDAMQIKAWDKQVQHKVLGGWMKGAGRTAEEAKRLFDIAKGTRAKAAQEAAGLYHPIGGGIKLSKPVELMQFETMKDPTVKGVQRKIITPEDLQGGIGIPLVGDRAAGGKLLTGVEGTQFRNPLTLEAGPDYMLTHTIPGSPESSIWRSGKGVVSGLQNQVEFARDMGRPIYGVNVVGAPTNVNYNTMVTEAILNQYDPASMTKKSKKEFLKDIRNYAPDPNKPHLKPGSVLTEADLNDVEALRAKMLAEGAGPLRKAFVERMGQAPFQEAGFPDVPASRLATTEPLLVDVPTGSAGFTVGTIDPAARALEQTPRGHKTYPISLAGEYFGSLDRPIDYRDIFQEFGDKRRAFGKPEGSDWRSFSLAPQFQTFDQEWLDRVMKSAGADKPREWKSGGSVEKADGGAVNMAEGGMTSDDLIVEERPL